MKNLKIFFLIAVISGFLASCEYDNYDEPKSLLQGSIVYNGEPINVAYNAVGFQLYEPGWELSYPIDVAVNQDGSYSALLFNGTYKLIIDPNQGPFRNITNSETQSDTINVQVKGNTQLDVEVMPYYMIRNENFSVSGRTVTATFGIEQIITGTDAKAVEAVHLSVHKRQFVDNLNNLANTDMAGADITNMSSISMNVTVPSMTPTQDYAFVRIGVKIAGVEDLIFSPVQRVEL